MMSGNTLAYPISTYTFGERRAQECEVGGIGPTKWRYAFAAIGMFATVSAVAMAFGTSRIESPVVPPRKPAPASLRHQAFARTRVEPATQAKIALKPETFQRTGPSVKRQASSPVSGFARFVTQPKSRHSSPIVPMSQESIASAAAPALEVEPFSQVGQLTYLADLQIDVPSTRGGGCVRTCSALRDEGSQVESPAGERGFELASAQSALSFIDDKERPADVVESRPLIAQDSPMRGGSWGGGAAAFPRERDSTEFAETNVNVPRTSTSSPLAISAMVASCGLRDNCDAIDLVPRSDKAAAADLIAARLDHPQTHDPADGVPGKRLLNQSSMADQPASESRNVNQLNEDSAAELQPLLNAAETSASSKLPASGEQSAAAPHKSGDSDVAAASPNAARESIAAHLKRAKDRYTTGGTPAKNVSAESSMTTWPAGKHPQGSQLISVSATPQLGSSVIVHDGEFVSINLGELISLFEAKLDRPLYVWMKSSSAASKFVTADTLAAAGIMTSYDPETRRLVLTLAGNTTD